MKLLTCLSLFFIIIVFIQSCQKGSDFVIIVPNAPSKNEILASKELRRYIYQRTGELMNIVQTDNMNNIKEKIILISLKNRLLATNIKDEDLKSKMTLLANQQYLIKSFLENNKKILAIIGGDEPGTLYGAYRFLETLGIRFYLHNDVIPDGKIKLEIPELEIVGKPAFELRGIQPFHDFPEGPDWWNTDDYKAIIAQLPKMGMNFIGFHTYPESKFTGYSKAEPMVWIGIKDDVNFNGTVKSAYPVLHANTQDSTWGYFAKKTYDFKFGAAQIFETDYFGADYMLDVSPWPHSDEENIEIFDMFGELQKDVFKFAGNLGVKTCLGTETPIVIPEKVKNRLKEKNIDPKSDQAIKAIYEGIFTRIMQLHPLDYYWFWTPEGWTWEEVKDEYVTKTEKDLRIAVETAKSLKTPFTLATCGWVLGPPKNRAQFDSILPKEMPFSCINREVGFTPVEPEFAKIKNRPKWQISWLEDDGALTCPQLWVGRVRKDAFDAFKYGCTGFMGIHWRTAVLSPQISALAQAGWLANNFKNTGDENQRDLASDDLYLDWANTNFGKEASKEIGDIFTKLDGGPVFIKGKTDQMTNLPRTAQWAGTGPGGLKVNMHPWDSVKAQYTFVDEFLKFQPKIKGDGNKERFEYWLNTFLYMRCMSETGCILGDIEKAVIEVKKISELKSQIKLIEDKVIPLRKKLVEKWGEMVTLFLQAVNTTGEMGTIANLSMHNTEQLQLLTKNDSLLKATYRKNLPDLNFWKNYQGKSRIIVPTKRTLLEQHEDLRLKIMVLTSGIINDVSLHWRHLGNKKYIDISATNVERHVYQVILPAKDIDQSDFEYYITAETDSEHLKYPATAGELNPSVVIFE